MANTGPAHAARRGQKESVELLVRKAASRFRLRLHIGEHERVIAKVLDAKGLTFAQQFPLGKYNLDFLLTEDRVAVEIVSGGGNKRVAKGRGERSKCILNQYNLIEIRLGHQRTIHCAEVVNQLIAYIEEFRRDHASRGEHRMIRADGRPILPGKQLNGRSIVFSGNHPVKLPV